MELRFDLRRSLAVLAPEVRGAEDDPAPATYAERAYPLVVHIQLVCVQVYVLQSVVEILLWRGALELWGSRAIDGEYDALAVDRKPRRHRQVQIGSPRYALLSTCHDDRGQGLSLIREIRWDQFEDLHGLVGTVVLVVNLLQIRYVHVLVQFPRPFLLANLLLRKAKLFDFAEVDVLLPDGITLVDA